MYNFNVEKTTKDCIDWIKDWMKNNGNPETKVVIGISGGKDSTVVAKLLVEALGKSRVIGLLMPNGEQKDISDSMRVCNFLGIENHTVNIEAAYKAITEALRPLAKNGKKFPTPMYETNTPARLRMVALYGAGALTENCRVVNTCNLSEDFVGYATYGGDGFNDFAPICRLTTEEVIAIGDYLGIPKDLTHKTPSDGMCGKSDEDNLGFTYAEVNKLIRENVKGEHYEEIMAKHKATKFKLENIRLPYFEPNLPLFNFLVGK